jgi:hypothetical protein
MVSGRQSLRLEVDLSATVYECLTAELQSTAAANPKPPAERCGK